MDWLKRKIRKWLGVSQLDENAAVQFIRVSEIEGRYKRMEETWSKATAEIDDVALRHGSNTRIVIASNIGQGFCRWYSLKFDDVESLNDFCQMLQERHVPASDPFIDASMEMRQEITMDRRKRKMGW